MTSRGRPKKIFDINKAIELRQLGTGWRAIAKEMGVSYQTVRRYLKARGVD